MIRIVMADDQAILCQSLKELIEKDPDISVVGTASNGQEAYDYCKQYRPDLALMDIRMPECDGIRGTYLIKKDFPDIKIIILTTFEDDAYISEAIRYGAEGYILKDISYELLTSAIKSVVKGLPVLHKKAMGVVAKRMEKGFSIVDKKKEIPSLNEKELKIIKYIVEGKSNKKIGELIHLSEGRIRNILSELFTKCGVKDRTQLAVYAVRKDIV